MTTYDHMHRVPDQAIERWDNEGGKIDPVNFARAKGAGAINRVHLASRAPVGQFIRMDEFNSNLRLLQGITI